MQGQTLTFSGPEKRHRLPWPAAVLTIIGLSALLWVGIVALLRLFG
ncbi:hypothetical protein [Muricoccus radiodurans]